MHMTRHKQHLFDCVCPFRRCSSTLLTKKGGRLSHPGMSPPIELSVLHHAAISQTANAFFRMLQSFTHQKSFFHMPVLHHAAIQTANAFFRMLQVLPTKNRSTCMSSPRLGDRFTSTCLFFIMLLARLGCTECGQSCSQTSSGTFRLAS